MTTATATSKLITYYGNPNAVLQSEYGNISYRAWCEKELLRMNEHGAKAKIVKNKKGLIALSR